MAFMTISPDAEPLEVGSHDLVDRQPALDRKLRRVADLGVDDAVGGEVLGALGGDADDRVALLHDTDRVGERLEIELEALPVRASTNPRGELRGVPGRQGIVAVLRREVDDRRRPESTVEVVMEERLRGLADRVEIEHSPSDRWADGSAGRAPRNAARPVGQAAYRSIESGGVPRPQIAGSPWPRQLTRGFQSLNSPRGFGFHNQTWIS
jgi:hypothetical protein